MPPHLEFRFVPSRQARWLQGAIHFSVAFCIVLLPLEPLIKTFLLVFIILSAVMHLRAGAAGRGCLLYRQGQWYFAENGGKAALAECRASFVSRGLLILRIVTVPSRVRYQPVFSDSLEAGALRRLKTLVYVLAN